MPENNPFTQVIQERGNPFSDEIARRIRPSDPENATPFDTFLTRTTRGITNMALQTPQAAGELLALLPAVPRLLPGGQTFTEEFRAQQQLQPAKFLREIPQIGIEDIASAAASVPSLIPGGESPPEAFERNRQAIFERDQAEIEANPFAAAAGDVASNVVALVGMRQPFAKGIADLERRFFMKPASDPASLARLADSWITSGPMRRLARGAGRSVETGIEAAVLDIVNGDDPLETAAYAAGGQAVGSVLAGFGRSVFSGSWPQMTYKLAGAALAGGVAIQMFENYTPVEGSSFNQAMTQGFDKVSWAMALGALSGVVGAGRFRNATEFQQAWPKLVDAMATTPRGVTLGLIEEYADADASMRQKGRIVMEQLYANPGSFEQDTINQLNRALEGGNFLETVDRLSTQDKRFAERLFGLEPPRLHGPAKGVIQRNAQDSR